MKNNGAAARFFRLTIRQMLVLSALIAVSFVAMRDPAASWWWLSTVAMMLVLATAAAVVAGKGPASYWCRGFIACMVVYGAMVHWSPRNEMSQTGWLPTTRWLSDFEPKNWKQDELEVTPSFPETEYAISSYPVNVGQLQGHYRTGHLMIALWCSVVGGRLAYCLHQAANNDEQ